MVSAVVPVVVLLLLGGATASVAIDQDQLMETSDTLAAKLQLLDSYLLRLDSYLSAADTQVSRRMLQAVVPDAMSGKHVTVVTMEDHPFTTKTSAPGSPSLSYSGFCPRMLEEVASRANFTYTWVPRTAAQANNGWAGAVNDVQAGHTDMFWSAFFLTSRRASLVDVTASFLDSGFQLVAKCDLGDRDTINDLFEWFAQTVEGPFSPFSRNLWWCTL
jgi:ABC-type amino acid transport substrate-binding protein